MPNATWRTCASKTRWGRSRLLRRDNDTPTRWTGGATITRTQKLRIRHANEKPKHKLGESQHTTRQYKKGPEIPPRTLRQHTIETHAKILGGDTHKGNTTTCNNTPGGRSAKKTRGGHKKPISANQAINIRIRTLMRNALVRTLTYALHTGEIQPGRQIALDQLARKCHREIYDPRWVVELTRTTL